MYVYPSNAAEKDTFVPPDQMDLQTLQDLLTKYQNGSATDDERTQVEAWYDTLDSKVESVLSTPDRQAFVKQHWQQLAAQTTQVPETPRMPRVLYRMAAAAVVVLAVGLGWYFLANRPSALTPVADRVLTEPNLLDQQNESEQPLRLALSDGSSVTLQPGSQLQYPKTFTGNQRAVRLRGEAFFEVAKNPKRPFLVYANGMVTKVLGTSFTVIAHAGKPTAEVSVRTGRVAVYRQTDAPAVANSPTIVLKPNEKATYYLADRQIVKALADQPTVLRPGAIKTHFSFDDTPVAEVFQELDDVYGVNISFDEQALVHCTLTANLANQPLLAQLNMICVSIGATYQTNGTQIRISSQGCP